MIITFITVSLFEFAIIYVAHTSSHSVIAQYNCMRKPLSDNMKESSGTWSHSRKYVRDNCQKIWECQLCKSSLSYVSHHGHSWSTFPSHHQQRKIPWNDLCDNSHWFVQCVRMERSVGNLDSFAVDLVSIASHISEVLWWCYGVEEEVLSLKLKLVWYC